MNRQRRKKLTEALEKITEVMDILESVKSEEEGKLREPSRQLQRWR